MNDIKLALRQFRKSPAFALTVILTISLGIGANVAIFTLVHAILLSSLPVSDPTSLYRIGDRDDCCVEGGFQNDDGDFDLFSYELYRQIQSTTPEFQQLAAFQSGQSTYNIRSGPGAAKAERTEFVSGNYFSTFGVQAFSGRMLQPSDDVPGAAPVAVLSYGAWQADHAADPHVIGSIFYFQNHPVTIVGIAPPKFFGDRLDDTPPAYWLPLNIGPVIQLTSNLKLPDVAWLYLLGRLNPGVSPKALQDKVSNTLRQFLAAQPAYTNNGADTLIPRQHVVIVPAGGGVQNLQQHVSNGLRLLSAISALVLIVACANIANLLLARGTTRKAETSIRSALGASRSLLIRQSLVESLLLSAAGGLIGIAIAYAGVRMIIALAFPEAVQNPIHATPSPLVLAFAVGLSLLTGVFFGIVPAWISSHSDPAEALRGLNRTTRDRAMLPQKSLIVLQAALSVVLLVSAGLMTETLRNLEHQNFGLQTANRYVVHFDPEGAGYKPETIRTLDEQLDREFSALPGVRSVGLALYSTLEGDNWGEGVWVQGHPAPHAGENSGSSWDRISPRFFKTVGQTIVHGRGITDQDTATSRMIAVVNQTFVRKFFPNEDPIGRHFGTLGQESSGDYEIVGVVSDAKYNNPREPVRPMYFRPLSQQNPNLKKASAIDGESASLFPNSITVQFTGDASAIEALARRTLSSINPDLTVVDFKSLDYQVAGNFNQERLITRLTTLFGLLALILASVGLYGITAYSVARRTNEIGLRMALGANRGNVVTLVLRGALLLVAIGLILGVPIALLGGRLMSSQLYGVKIYNPLAIASSVMILAVFALIAGLIPARRAAGIEPMNALRTE